jgi:hypothetical protein
MDSAHAPGRTGWHLARLRARMDPPRNWQVDAGLGLTRMTEELVG